MEEEPLAVAMFSYQILVAFRTSIKVYRLIDDRYSSYSYEILKFYFSRTRLCCLSTCVNVHIKTQNHAHISKCKGHICKTIHLFTNRKLESMQVLQMHMLVDQEPYLLLGISLHLAL
jgi:flavoprotein